MQPLNRNQHDSVAVIYSLTSATSGSPRAAHCSFSFVTLPGSCVRHCVQRGAENLRTIGSEHKDQTDFPGSALPAVPV